MQCGSANNGSHRFRGLLASLPAQAGEEAGAAGERTGALLDDATR